MFRHLPLLVLSALVACSVDLAVPENVLVRCDNGECPSDYHCNNAHLCVPSTSDDSIAPTIANAVYVPAIVGAGGATTLSFDVSEALLIDPVVTFTNNSVARSFTVITRGGTHYELNYPLRGDERDGESSVSADLIDRVGNTNTVMLPSMRIDQKPPGIVAGSVSLTLTPNRASNPLTDVTAITTGTTVRLTFATDETITTAPVVSIGDSVLLTTTASSSTVFVAEQQWDAPGLADGVQSVSVILVDPAGNASTVAIDVTAPSTPNGFLVDTTPPLPPVNTTLRRAPWGELGGSAPDGALTAGAGAVVPGTHITAYDAPSIDYCASPTCSFASLGLSHAIADGDGSFNLDLGQTDRRIIYLAAIDQAGNASDIDTATAGLQASPVTSAQLVVTFNALPGRTNPSSAVNLERLPRLVGDAVGVALDSSALRTRDDGKLVTASGGYVWQQFGAQAGVPNYSAGRTSAAALPRFGQVVMSATSFPTVTFWVRDAQGLAQRPSSPIAQSALVYDPVNDGVLAVGNTMALWDGAQWTGICPGNVCQFPSIGTDALAADLKRRVVVLVGSSGATYEWDGTLWAPKCTSIPCSGTSPGSAVALAYDGVLGEILLLTNGGETWSWDGNRWMRRCTACGPPARSETAMAYDEARRKVVLYGGTPSPQTGPNQEGTLSDTWTWDGASWHQETPATNPGGGAIHRGMAFDVRRHRVVLMGGYAPDTQFIPAYPAPDSFWEWDGRQWSRPADFDDGFDAIAFDPLSRTTVATCPSSASDKKIRAWDGLEWASTGVACPANNDGQLTRATYGANDRLVYWTTGATYVYDASGLMQQRCSGSACGLPSDGQVASDGVNAMYAGEDFVYRFNGTTWSQICVGCGSHTGSTMGYNPALTVGSKTGFLVSIGGLNNPTMDYLDGTTWHALFSPSLPNALISALAYDTGRGELAWVGGTKPNQNGPPSVRPVLGYIAGTAEDAELYLLPSSSKPPTRIPTSQALIPVASYDEELQTLIMFDKAGGATYTYTGATEHPALLLNIPLFDSIDVDDDIIDSYAVDWYGTATSSAAGIAAAVWNVDHWTALTVTAESDHTRAAITQDLLRYLSGLSRTLTLAITPAGTNGAGRAVLSTDAVSVQIAYHAAP